MGISEERGGTEPLTLFMAEKGEREYRWEKNGRKKAPYAKLQKNQKKKAKNTKKLSLQNL